MKGVLASLCVVVLTGGCRPSQPSSPNPGSTPDRAAPTEVGGGGADPAEDTDAPVVPDSGSDGDGVQPSTGRDPDCLDGVERGEALAPLEGWSSWITLPERYREPEVPTPDVFREGTDCVQDPRPAFSWCVKREYGPDGTLLRSAGPKALRLAELPHFSPGEFRRTLRRSDGYPYVEAGTVDDRGNLVEWSLADGPTGDVFERWRLRYACDGRPARYEALVGTAPPPFLYDAHGRPTRLVYPNATVLQSWYDDGGLRARETFRDNLSAWHTTRQLLDEQGRIVADEASEILSMGSKVLITLVDPETKTTRAIEDYPGHDWWISSVLREGAAAGGRPGLTWSSVEPLSDAARATRSVKRTTSSCETGAPVRDELDLGADGTIDEVVDYEWLPEVDTVRATSSTGATTEYLLRCD